MYGAISRTRSVLQQRYVSVLAVGQVKAVQAEWVEIPLVILKTMLDQG